MFLVDLSRRHDFHLSCDSGKFGVRLGMILDHHLTERLDVGSLASFSGYLSEPHLCQPNNRHLANEQARISLTGLLGCYRNMKVTGHEDDRDCCRGSSEWSRHRILLSSRALSRPLLQMQWVGRGTPALDGRKYHVISCDTMRLTMVAWWKRPSQC